MTSTSAPAPGARLWLAAIGGWVLLLAGLVLTHWLHMRGVGHLLPELEHAEFIARRTGEAVLVPAWAAALLSLVHPETPFPARCIGLLGTMFSTFFLYVLFAGWSLL